MEQSLMMALVERHLKAEGAGDIEGAVDVYVDDIEHDVVGFPGGILHGKDAARGFYDELSANFRTERERPIHRYFSSAQSLWEEASLEIIEDWDTGQIDQVGDDPRARLDAVVQGVGWHMLDDELPYRNLVRASLERWYEQSGLPADERMPVRQGRRMVYNTKVVEPLRHELPDVTIDQLVNALALVWGTEAVLVLRDVCRLDTEQAKDTMLRASRWMLEGFLAQHQPRKR